MTALEKLTQRLTSLCDLIYIILAAWALYHLAGFVANSVVFIGSFL